MWATNEATALEWRWGMSDTQSQIAQSGALHHGSAAIINANLVAGSLQNFERRARGKPHRLVFIKQNQGLEKSNPDGTTGPREICCLFLADAAKGIIDDPTVG